MKIVKWGLSACCFAVMVLSVACKKENADNTAVNPPVIANMQPVTGPKGTTVTLTGSNFTNDISNAGVYVNGKYADVIYASTTEIRFVVPAKAGTGQIALVIGGQSIAGPVFNFIYTVSVNIFSGFSLMPGNTDGSAAAARFNAPLGMAIDQNNNLYVADELNHCIRKVTPAGDVSTFCGNGIAGHQDGNANTARFNFPSDITYDAINGYFYVADKGNHCIRKVNLSGTVFTVAGIPGSPGYVDAPGLSARLENPAGVAVEGELANIYIADQGNHCIRKLDHQGLLTTFSGSTVPGQQDGTGIAAKFSAPADITWDTAGYLYVTDIINQNIRRISKNSQQVVTAAGVGVAGFQDGTTALSLFNNPVGILAENNEAIVCDVLNHRIRVLKYGISVATLSGDGTAAFSDGTGTQAKFNKPGGIVRDSYGDYFITDTGNNAVRRMVID
jgi:uncharacterized protein (TIGR03437 family)